MASNPPSDDSSRKPVDAFAQTSQRQPYDSSALRNLPQARESDPPYRPFWVEEPDDGE